MKKILSWEVLVSIAIIAFFIKSLLEGFIGDSFAIIGIIASISAYFTYKKSKNTEEKIKQDKFMKKILEKTKKNKLFLLVICSVIFTMLIFFTFFYDIGLNSKYFVKKDFSEAFLFRQTGNCEEFVKYINKDWANWFSRCYKEKSEIGDVRQINSFAVKEVTINNNKGFLQVEIKRNNTDNKEYNYMVNYEMIRSRGGWLIDQSI